MTGPEISVIIPHLNQAGFLSRCLGSMRAQTLARARFEIIVVDNGSRERPEGVVAEFASVRLIDEAEPGPGPARNCGVAASTAPILAFIDADCTADANWLAVIAARLADPEARLILGGDVRIASADPERLTILEAYESVFAYRQREYINKYGFSGTGNLAVRRSDFERIGPFGGISVAEDREWGRRAGQLGFQIVYVPDMIVYHPARRDMSELFTKWDRHISHDFAEWQLGGKGRARWFARSMAVAISPCFDLIRIIRSGRLKGWKSRAGAAYGLFRIRGYRALKMIALAWSTADKSDAAAWNR